VGIPVVQAFGMELTISAMTHSVKFNTMVDLKVLNDQGLGFEGFK
jgi:hypothetical protein